MIRLLASTYDAVNTLRQSARAVDGDAYVSIMSRVEAALLEMDDAMGLLADSIGEKYVHLLDQEARSLANGRMV